MLNEYTLSCHNESELARSFMVFQKSPDTGNPGVYSLAWFSKFAHPATDVVFNWSIDYSLTWSETGVLVPGVKFVASQHLPADPTGKDRPNRADFSRVDGAYLFTNPDSTAAQGSLQIDVDATIPTRRASVGIGMSGSGTFAVQAQPGDRNVFTPKPTYWIAFGTWTQGQVLDVQSISNVAALSFPPAEFHLDVTYTDSGKWIIKGLAEANAQRIKELQAV